MIKKIIYFLVIIFYTSTATAQSTAREYIENYRNIAVKLMNEHGIPASIILGIAMHESGAGTSRIAKYNNNHFGLKGKGGPKTVPSAYKGYESVQDCYSDFIDHMENRFSGLFTRYHANDYRGWAKGIQRGGYASSKTWASQVLGIIRKYNLTSLDSTNAKKEKSGVGFSEDTEISNPIVYFVKKGDTLLALARRFEISVSEIKEKNDLSSNILQIGQKLHL